MILSPYQVHNIRAHRIAIRRFSRPVIVAGPGASGVFLTGEHLGVGAELRSLVLKAIVALESSCEHGR